MEREFYDTKLEKSILSCLAKNDKFFTKLHHKGLPKDKIFADISHRLIFKCICDYYLKYNVLPSKTIIKNHIKRVKNNKIITNRIKENSTIILDRIYDNKLNNEDINLFDLNYNELTQLYNLRELQNHIKLLADDIDNADIEKAKNRIQSFNFNENDEFVEEYEFSDGAKQRLEKINFFRKNYDKFSPIPTGIVHVDNSLQGGFLNELVLFAANSNMGKTALLHQVCMAARNKGKNGIIFTIEMDRDEASTRIDSAISGIKLNKFRNPKENADGELSQMDINIWWKRIKRKKGQGKLWVVSFLNGATVPDIRSKTTQIMKREKIRIDYIVIDYLTDLLPVGKKYDSSKDWNAQGEISWSLHLMAKGFQNLGLPGIPIITACTLRKQTKAITTASSSDGKDNRRVIDERDIGISPLLFQHANFVFGIREHAVYKEFNQLVMMKGRGAEKGMIADVCPNFPYGRFHDSKLMEIIHKKHEEEGSIDLFADDSEIIED